jgi:pyruvate dehydrogenase E1 component
MNQVLKAQEILEEKYNVAADVWSVTSYKQLRQDALNVERWNLLHPNDEPQAPYVTQCLKDVPGVLVAASDYMKLLPDSIRPWLDRPLVSLGTDGFGRSESRQALRDFFEVDHRFVTLATLNSLAKEGQLSRDVISAAMEDLQIDPNKPNPLTS